MPMTEEPLGSVGLRVEQTEPSGFASVLPRLFANQPKYDLADLQELAK